MSKPYNLTIFRNPSPSQGPDFPLCLFAYAIIYALLLIYALFSLRSLTLHDHNLFVYGGSRRCFFMTRLPLDCTLPSLPTRKLNVMHAACNLNLSLRPWLYKTRLAYTVIACSDRKQVPSFSNKVS